MKLQITIEGHAYEVDVQLLDEDAASPEELLPPPPLPGVAGQPSELDPNACHSPVNGLVVRVNVEPGQVVVKDAVLLVLEAMKMETNILAPRAAMVRAVHVKLGEPVKSGQILVEFEKESGNGNG